MLKIVYCVRRRPDLSEEEFHRYWLEEHGSLVRSMQSELPITRYVQSHALPGAADASRPEGTPQGEPYDGITEVWLDETAVRGRSEEITANQRRLMEDEMRFVDHARSCMFYTVEHEIF
jgi:EthD domain